MTFTVPSGRQANMVLLAVALCLLGSRHAAQASPPAKHVRYYQLTVNYQDLKPDIRVNDMPIQVTGNTDGFVVEIINRSLIGAGNTLTITTLPAQGEAYVPVGASLQVNLTSFDKDKGGNPQVLFDSKWKRKDTKGALPHISHVFQVTPPAEPLSWQNGAVLQKAALDKAGINVQVKRLHTALETKNIPETLALLSSEAHDEDIGLGVPHHSPTEEDRAVYEKLFRDPSWKVSPIHYGTLKYDLYGGGRVVWVHPPGQNAVFRSSTGKDGGYTVFDMYLSLINGHWVIVR